MSGFVEERDAVGWAETGSLGAERESDTQNGSEETFKRVQSLFNSHKETEGVFYSEPLKTDRFLNGVLNEETADGVSFSALDTLLVPRASAPRDPSLPVIAEL